MTDKTSAAVVGGDVERALQWLHILVTSSHNHDWKRNGEEWAVIRKALAAPRVRGDAAAIYVQAIRNVCLDRRKRHLDIVTAGYAIQDEYERLAAEPKGDASNPAEQTRGDGMESANMLADALAEITATRYDDDPSSETYDADGHSRCIEIADAALLRYESAISAPRQSVPDGLEKDAARYRFLKANHLDKWVDAKTHEPSSCGFNFEGATHDVDADIDAAMLAAIPSAERTEGEG